MISLKLLHKDYKLYGAKNKNIGLFILEYTKKNEQNKKKKCIYENISWFGDLDQAKHYETKDTKIFTWIALKQIILVRTNRSNERFFKELFLTNNNIELSPCLQINKTLLEIFLKENPLNHPYLSLNNNEKAWYEFAFAFGYMRVEEQYKFLQLLYTLLYNKIIIINMRNGKSISTKVYGKIKYYSLYPFKKQDKYNRLSFYDIDKTCLTNLCLLLKANKKLSKIDGVYQKDTSSFWFPNLVIYKMNIQEYILFSPHECLSLLN
jgi:hypothetical protein